MLSRRTFLAVLPLVAFPVARPKPAESRLTLFFADGSRALMQWDTQRQCAFYKADRSGVAVAVGLGDKPLMRLDEVRRVNRGDILVTS